MVEGRVGVKFLLLEVVLLLCEFLPQGLDSRDDVVGVVLVLVGLAGLGHEVVQLRELCGTGLEADGNVGHSLHLCHGCGIALGLAAHGTLRSLQSLQCTLACLNGGGHVRLRGEEDLVLGLALLKCGLHVLILTIDFLSELCDLSVQSRDLGAPEVDLLIELGDLGRRLRDGVLLVGHPFLAEAGVLVVGSGLGLALLLHLDLQLPKEADDLLDRGHLGGLAESSQRER
mmetsp:Transcript_104611/g.300747  ORF Transcript_104611/g.300747 Transcript_104611/m.300747 type:complete len:229 (+) Transcript_104611:1571-2257(+)